MRRRSSNPQTPNPIWKEICPCKSSISILTLSISCSAAFYPLTRDFNWNPELLLWRAGFVFLYRSLPVTSFETIQMWFLQSLVFISEPRRFHRPLFFEYLGVHFPNSGYVSNSVLKFRIRIDGLCLRQGVFWNLFRDLLALHSLGCVSFKTFRSLYTATVSTTELSSYVKKCMYIVPNWVALLLTFRWMLERAALDTLASQVLSCSGHWFVEFFWL